MRIVALFIATLLSSFAIATPIEPGILWQKGVSSDAPVIDHKLGLVKVNDIPEYVDLANGPEGFQFTLRKLLKASGFFNEDSKSSERVRVEATFLRRELSKSEKRDEWGSGPGQGYLINYKVKVGESIIYDRNIEALTDNVFFSGDFQKRTLGASLKIFMADFRRTIDPDFREKAVELIAEAESQIDRRSVISYMGEGALKGFYHGVVGTATAVKKAGEVVGDVVSSDVFAAVVTGAAQGYADASNEIAQQDQQRREAEYRRSINNYSEYQRQQAEAEAQARRDEQAQSRSSTQTARASSPEPEEAQDTSKEEKAARTPKRSTSTRASERGTSASGGGDAVAGGADGGGAQPGSKPTSSSTNRPASPSSEHVATPEAVIVCTRPSGPDKRFTCENPINDAVGSATDSLPEERSPEAMAASWGATCPERRRLSSSTHLVWGCGFGATGANNALDRGAGVSIQGRRTYYCKPREFSCRRTSP